jgi:hypothetical protein
MEGVLYQRAHIILMCTTPQRSRAYGLIPSTPTWKICETSIYAVIAGTGEGQESAPLKTDFSLSSTKLPHSLQPLFVE